MTFATLFCKTILLMLVVSTRSLPKKLSNIKISVRVYSLELDSNANSHFMQLALRHAQFSFRDKEVPVGAVIVDENNQVLAASRNRVEATKDATMHAEIDCIRKASFVKKNWRLSGCTIYTTLEPCHMCLGAIQAARIKHVVFAAYANKVENDNVDNDGSLTSLTMNNSGGPEITGGVLEAESSILLKRFFKQRREEQSPRVTAAGQAIE